MATPTLIYCAGGNPAFRRAATEAGWANGARLPDTVYDPPLHFADQHYKKPDMNRYVEAVAKHKPRVATVLDIESDGQAGQAMTWAEAIAPHVETVVFIPKMSGVIAGLPRCVGNATAILGYSVPTSYGGTPLGTWDFRGWPVHLLGGSPHKQIELARYMSVVSVDGSMAQQQACRCRYWSRAKGPEGHWRQLGGARRAGNHLEAFRRSLDEISEAWSRTTGGAI